MQRHTGLSLEYTTDMINSSGKGKHVSSPLTLHAGSFSACMDVSVQEPITYSYFSQQDMAGIIDRSKCFTHNFQAPKRVHWKLSAVFSGDQMLAWHSSILSYFMWFILWVSLAFFTLWLDPSQFGFNIARLSCAQCQMLFWAKDKEMGHYRWEKMIGLFCWEINELKCASLLSVILQ